MATIKRKCLECDTGFTADRINSRFCSRKCCKVFQNRRMLRGSELYDWVMGSRYQRTAYPNAITVIAQMAREFREKDKKDRDGRFSWSDLERSER